MARKDKKKKAEAEKATAPEPANEDSLKDLEGDAPSAAEPKQADTSTKDGKKKPQADEGKMWIKVYSPYQVYYDDQAASISAVNETGPFDILGHHHKFLTLLEPCELNIINDDDEQKIKIARGVMYVKEDRVTVFLDI